MAIFPVIGAAAILLLSSSAAAAQPPTSELRARVERYEQALAQNKADDAELVATARLALEQAANAMSRRTVIEACSSTFTQNDASCQATLWRIARQTPAPLADRLAASAALVRRKAKGAADLLLELANGAKPAHLLGAVQTLIVLPPEKSVPILSRMLASDDVQTMSAACRVLGAIDSSESRQTIASFLETSPRGTTHWNACMLAAARLGNSDMQMRTRFMAVSFKGFELISGGEVLLPMDQQLATSLWLQATRQGTGLIPLEAADRLAPFEPDAAAAVMRQALQSTQIPMRAGALQVHRSLKLDPDADARARLIDVDPLVRLRAAETILEWYKRRREKQPAAETEKSLPSLTGWDVSGTLFQFPSCEFNDSDGSNR
jgi:hypothetical protein